jgi:hypothetical protein
VVRKAPVERLGARAYRAPAGAKLRGVNADHEGGSPDRHESSSDAASTRYSRASKGYAAADERPSVTDLAEALRRGDIDFDEWGFPILAREPRPSLPEPRDGWMPDSALAGVAGSAAVAPASPKSRQVNIRLDSERYGALKRAGDLYGVTPTTLARVLVNRGVEALLNAYRAEQMEI